MHPHHVTETEVPEMRIDAYTKIVLTIIAVSLVWIAAGGPSVVPPVEAQIATPTRVIVVGWEDRAQFVYRLPEMPESLRGQTILLPVRQQKSLLGRA
jgi:hypothetical protein